MGAWQSALKRPWLGVWQSAHKHPWQFHILDLPHFLSTSYFAEHNTKVGTWQCLRTHKGAPEGRGRVTVVGRGLLRSHKTQKVSPHEKPYLWLSDYHQTIPQSTWYYNNFAVPWHMTVFTLWFIHLTGEGVCLWIQVYPVLILSSTQQGSVNWLVCI